jgi:amidohydrolase
LLAHIIGVEIVKIDQKIRDMTPDVVAWRRHLHQHPELLFEVHRTAEFVARHLRSFACDDVATEIGRTGVVGVVHGGRGTSGKTIGLRADMDALPIREETNLPYSSTIRGRMHACGHDGHMAMLLGAARHLAQTRAFDGTVVFIFQPAEEGGGGGLAMIQDGLMERFGICEVYGMHNLPGLQAGHFATRPGAIMASNDQFFITVHGRGAHAAMPHEGIDPVLAGAHIVTALQSIASRNIDPIQSVVVSATMLEAGSAVNVIPTQMKIGGTVRTLSPHVRQMVKERLANLAKAMAASFGAEIEMAYESGYPPTINHATQALHALDAARSTVGESCVSGEASALMASEDFAYMLERCPGALVFIGNGESAGLHHPSYDFNDAIIPCGVQYWVNLAQARAAGLPMPRPE